MNCKPEKKIFENGWTENLPRMYQAPEAKTRLQARNEQLESDQADHENEITLFCAKGGTAERRKGYTLKAQINSLQEEMNQMRL